MVHPVDRLAGSPCAVVCEAHVVDMVPAGQQRLHLAVDTVHHIQTRHVAVLEGHVVVQDGIFAGHAYGVYAYGLSAGLWLLVGCLAARNAKQRCQQSDGHRACELIYRGWNLVHLGCI